MFFCVQLAWLSCALFTLIVCSILIGLAVALAIELRGQLQLSGNTFGQLIETAAVFEKLRFCFIESINV